MNARNKERKNFDFGAGRIIGHSEELHKIFKLIEMVAKTEATVLIQGDSGTGKELIANAIHYTSLRSHAPFIKINCAALPENLLESELFGYKKGAFTGAYKDKKGMFEMADGGTLLLDEIGNMSLGGQIKLLRVLQEGEIVPVGDSRSVPVDVRVLVTTNIYLAGAVKKGEFREDLFYRLQVVTFEMPTLRELKMDIPMLVDHFIYKQSKKHHRPIKGISPAALEILMHYDWPGNIRELEHTIERAIIMEHTDIIQP
jgi:transcriptional regulator with PAS, ATPase and Fis domain